MARKMDKKQRNAIIARNKREQKVTKDKEAQPTQSQIWNELGKKKRPKKPVKKYKKDYNEILVVTPGSGKKRK